MKTHCRTLFASSAAALLALTLAGSAYAQRGAKHPDLTGTYDNATDFATAGSAVVAKPGESLCIFGCAPAGPPAGKPAAGFQISRGFVIAPPDPPKYKPEFAAKVKDLNDRQVDEDTSLRCAPPGVPRIGPPEKIIQNAREVVFLYEDIAGPLFRVVPIDGRKHRTDLDRAPLGDSIGHWESDTLVVETTNFTDDTWLTDDGAFHTKNLRVVERLRRTKDGGLEWQATAYDPDVLAEPYAKAPRMLPPAKSEIVVSARCMEQSLAQMQDKSFHTNPR